jgi:hypothetical protein
MSTSRLSTFLSDYLGGLVHPKKPVSLPPPFALSVYVLVPLTIFAISSFISNYAVIANDVFVQQILDRTVSKADTPEKRRAAESARESVEVALRSPGVRILITLKGMLISIWSLLSFVLLFALIFVPFVDKQGLLGIYFREALSLTIILSLGFAVNVGLKFVSTDHRMTLGPALAADLSGDSNPIIFLVQRFDFFTLWYLTNLSIRISRFAEENVAIVMAIAIACTVILSLAALLLDFPFVLMP